ncbi:MAG: MogA/MoaB family molybdenum cofactor biosynthesis protein [Methanotrichaceae archaeon]|nr:MogA/MoaB family molybdenum cofactor biosynthesis protein [Methanotrichaceae archaeon]
MIIDVFIASTSRFKKFGNTTSPEGAEDLSGKLILENVVAKGHKCRYQLLTDGIEPIRKAVQNSVADGIIICGGTGLTKLDLTLEAVEPLFEKKLPGFGELFRLRSFDEIGTRAILTRASAGVIEGRPVFCIPGSPNAAKLGAEIILAELDHIVEHIRE